MARALRILFVDDDENDRTLLNRAAKRFQHEHMICSVDSAQQAMQFLEQKVRQSSPLPHLLLVDLRMPEMDGFEFLEWLKQHPRLNKLPVIVLSGSGSDHDIDRAYDLGARSFLTKPVRLDHLARDLQALLTFWSMCELPSSHGPASTDLN